MGFGVFAGAVSAGGVDCAPGCVAAAGGAGALAWSCGVAIVVAAVSDIGLASYSLLRSLAVALESSSTATAFVAVVVMCGFCAGGGS